MSESEIIARLKNGDQEAFRALVGTYQDRILNGAFRFVRNTEAAEDITQEVFMEIFESIRSFRGDSQLSTWLYRIMVAKSLNWIRNTNRKKRFGVILPIVGFESAEEQLVSTENLPEEELERTERADALTRALERLPLNQRTAFTLHKINNISQDEIAEIMGVSHSAVESLIHRAKENLRKLLSDYYKDQLNDGK